MTEIEKRVSTETWPLEDFDIRTTATGMQFRGYAAVFNSDSKPLPFIERLRPGAFSKTLKEKSARRLFLNHNTDIVLGSTKAGTLTLTEDDRGLLAEADLPDNEWGRPVADGIRRGDIDSMSFGFSKVRDEWPDPNHREVIEARLFEVSIVTGFPAYEATSASVRTMPDDLAEALRLLTSTSEPLSEEAISLINNAIEARRLPVSRLAEWQAAFSRL